MRIVRFASPQGMSFGVLDGDGNVAQIDGHPFGQITFTGARYAQADVRLLSPILPSKVVCVGKNYAAHVAEMKTGDAPKEPLLFLKPSTSVIVSLLSGDRDGGLSSRRARSAGTAHTP